MYRLHPLNIEKEARRVMIIIVLGCVKEVEQHNILKQKIKENQEKKIGAIIFVPKKETKVGVYYSHSVLSIAIIVGNVAEEVKYVDEADNHRGCK
jgi:hypothetical protein